MGSMPEVIAKGPVFTKMETLLNARPRRQAFLDDLRTSSSDLLTLATQHNSGLTQQESNNINTLWFNRHNWLSGQVESVMRESLIAALEWAMNPALGGGTSAAVDPPPPLPPPQQADIACFWVCDPGHATPVHPPVPAPPQPLEVSISWDSDRVTVIFHTPHPDWNTVSTPNFEDSVVVKEDPGVKRVRVKIELPA